MLKENESLGIALVGGPFRHMSGGWTFQQLSDAGSKVELDLQFEFESRATDVIFGRFFENTCNSPCRLVHSESGKDLCGLRSFLPWRTSRNCWSLSCRMAPQLAWLSRRSGLARQFPDIDFDTLQTGVWGKPMARNHVVREGDRVELYRPLEMDPRDARRLKVGG